jgi:Ferredoxin
MKITIEKPKCIGCGTCASLCPKYFEMGEDGKSRFKDSKSSEGEEIEIKEAECTQDAANSCPVQCIHLEK